jgi:hypothetical protein
MKSPTIARGVLAAGALGFGVFGIASPARLARMLGSDEATAREVGFRDLGNGLVILAAPTAGIAQRMLYDVSDAIMFGRRRPRVAVGALGFATLGAYTLASR